MPYFNIKTNAELSKVDAAAVVKAASKFCAEALGKPEGYVEVALQSCAMSFAGDAAPCAIVELWSIGLPKDAPKKLTPQICDFLGKKLNVKKDRIYINFQNINGAFWGHNDQTFG